MNNWSGVGRTTKDIEIRYTQAGTAVGKTTLAVARARDREKADFINITIWGKTAENFAKYCGKGSMVSIIGHIETNSFEGQDGKRVYTWGVTATEVQYIDTKKTTGAEGYREAALDGAKWAHTQESTQGKQQQQQYFNNDGGSQYQQPQKDFNENDLPF